ncbi:unnamed protein product, partial [Linum tenue]
SSRKPAIHPATVYLNGKAYGNPGPLQFDGPGADAKAVTSCVEDQDYMGRMQEYLDKVRTIVKPGCSPEVLKAALSVMAPVTEVLTTMSSTPSKWPHLPVERLTVLSCIFGMEFSNRVTEEHLPFFPCHFLF